MKIIGLVGNVYRVEATEDELAIAAGYPNAMASGWRRRRPATNDKAMLQTGGYVNVSDASIYHVRILAIRDELRKAAKEMGRGDLDELAEKIDRALSSPYVPNITDQQFPTD